MSNPWIMIDLERERALQVDTPEDDWAPAILAAYAGHDSPVGPCRTTGCGGQLWYRERTGGPKCPNCLAFRSAA